MSLKRIVTEWLSKKATSKYLYSLSTPCEEVKFRPDPERGSSMRSKILFEADLLSVILHSAHLSSAVIEQHKTAPA